MSKCSLTRNNILENIFQCPSSDMCIVGKIFNVSQTWMMILKIDSLGSDPLVMFWPTSSDQTERFPRTGRDLWVQDQEDSHHKIVNHWIKNQFLTSILSQISDLQDVPRDSDLGNLCQIITRSHSVYQIHSRIFLTSLRWRRSIRNQDYHHARATVLDHQIKCLMALHRHLKEASH